MLNYFRKFMFELCVYHKLKYLYEHIHFAPVKHGSAACSLQCSTNDFRLHPAKYINLIYVYFVGMYGVRVVCIGYV